MLSNWNAAKLERDVASRSARSRVEVACVLAGSLLASFALPVTGMAQTPPSQMRIQVVPAEPGIRSILLNKRYRPIISRGIEGAVIETAPGGGDTASVGCQVELEVTLENSRVLRRSADICGSGGTVVVDVNKDPGPGRARVVGTDAVPVAPSPGAATAPKAQAPSSPPATQAETKPPVQPAPQPQAQPQTQPAAPQPAPQTAPVEVPSAVTEALGRQQPAGQPLGQPAPGQQVTSGTIPGAVSGPVSGTIPGAAPILPALPVERSWSISGTQLGSQTAVLVHAGPQGVDLDFQASCTPQSGLATLRLMRPSPGTTPGAMVPVTIRADEFYATYDAVGTVVAGQTVPEFNVSLMDPLWDAMARKVQLDVIVDDVSQAVSLKGSAQPVRLFTATCAEPQKIVEDSQDPALAGAGELSCAEFGSIRSLDGGFRGRMLFRNARSEPVDVFWIDYAGAQRFYARLLPGQVLDQESILSNAWMVTSANGQCLGLYVSRAPRQDVVVGNRVSGGPSPLGSPAPMSAGPLPPAPIGGVDSVNYLCTAGIDLQVQFDGARDIAVVTEFGQISVTLPRVPSGSGFRYESGGYSLAGQRDNATWSRPGLYDAFCARN
ncbi:MAG: MliC family protein [Pannonibacter sp.]